MQLDPYHHKHPIVEEIPWSRLGKLLIQLAIKIRSSYNPEVVVGIAKGGVIPAVFLSSAYLLDFFPIKLSSRHNEQIISDNPVWHVYPTGALKAKKVLLVDDICAAGRTMEAAKKEIMKSNAKEICTAALAVHENSVKPDYFILKTDALIVWPWDRDVLSGNDTWSINPEYMEEMTKITGYIPGPSPAREPMGQWEK
jgi:hypoxanthine phosphoribosyltransferase